MDSLNGFLVFVQVAETRSFVADGRLHPILADHVERAGVFHVLWPANKPSRPRGQRSR